MIIPTIVKPPQAGGHEDVELGIMKQFTFSSELQVSRPDYHMYGVM